MDVEILEPENNNRRSSSCKRNWSFNIACGPSFSKPENVPYTVGSLMALGMNFYKTGFSLHLLWSIFSWADVGYLLTELLSKNP